MLTITVGSIEVFDETSQKFGVEGGVDLQLEHSLASLSKWESIHEKPFLGKDEKTPEEVLSYIKCMILDDEIPPEVFRKLSNENVEQINKYINAKMTATWFNDPPGKKQTQEIITAEVIYHWLIQFQIPFECENWHLNRLFTLIRVCSLKSAKPKKMSRAEAIAQRKNLNSIRKAQMGTNG